MNRRASCVGTFEVFEAAHVALRTLIISIFSASQLHFLANRNAELAGAWQPVNCINIGRHVALLSGPSIHFLFYGHDPSDNIHA